MELIHQTRRQFRGVGGRTTEARTLRISPSHAQLPHGSANFSQGSSGPSASLLDSYDGHGDSVPTDHKDPARRQVHSFRVRFRLVCSPSLDPHFLRRRQSFVLRKAVPRLPLPRSFRPILWTQRMPFLRRKKTPPLIIGKQLRDPSTSA